MRARARVCACVRVCVCARARARASVVSCPDPDSQQLRMDYITATWKVGLVSSCTNFCPAPPTCWGDQSDLRYALMAYCSYQSKLLVMAVRLSRDG